MRLFLLPISTRRSLIYCEKLHEKVSTEHTYLDKLTNKASETWAAWEKDSAAIGNWKKKVTIYGNLALKRIPYEEWGLKSMPALTAKRRKSIEEGNEKVQVLFPGLYMKEGRVPVILKELAMQRQALHKKNLVWSVVAMPFTVPFMLIPVIPNLPFFYLVYRAYSHWRALNGSKFLAFLLQHKLPTPAPSAELDEVYAAGLMYATRAESRAAPIPTREQAEEISRVVDRQTNNETEDVMMLQRWNGKLIAERFKLPEMEVEIERAVEQVEKAIKGKEELMEEKMELEQATKTSGQPLRDLHDEVPSRKADEAIHEKAEDVAHHKDKK
ncbi:hypothetical protein GQ43DRAFT_429286 [Delitschia confertaspora ATCC 74209]|uniref:Mitochondrial K+-H+ exchange-related-domain-containing protein n=1 Tax=Delitschia confertaspora ATCC 74209 TaxID=1513339 RepID=A0A9P4JQW8_9PLEO|nr:hypothetical protein GQ43DRAFT_429286 [Delitschia confertaspora ATCC 74209]